MAEKYIPTFEEVWETGYRTHTGTFKKGIFQNKNSATDLDRLIAVKEALEEGKLKLNVESLDKFNKTRAMELFAELKEMNRQGELDKLVATRPDNYITIDTTNKMNEFMELAKYESLIAVDTETTGLDYIDNDNIVGLSISLNTADKHYYFPFAHTTGEVQLDEWYIKGNIKKILENPKYKAVYHNAKFDLHMFKKWGIDATKSFHFCTQVGFKLLSENEPRYALKVLATKYGKNFGFDDKSSTFEELFGKDCLFSTVPLQYASVYAIKDTQLTLNFYKWIMTFYKKMPEFIDYWKNIEREILLVSLDMEENGMPVDKQAAREYAVALKDEVDALEAKLQDYFPDVNVNSPKQLSEYLFDTLELKDPSGKRSTDKKVLKILAKQYEGCQVLLDYRDKNKLYSTYILPLPEKVAERDKRLHGSFMQDGTVTGRFASANPNLQNLPYPARHIVVAPEGKVIIGIDYSQIEPRTLASLSGDVKFKEPYLTGRDLYSEIASNVLKKPYEECGDGSKWRKMAKVILLGVMYGMTPMSLADSMGISPEEAEEFVDSFFETYQGVSEFQAKHVAHADAFGYVQTKYKRRRRFVNHVKTAQAYWEAYRKIEDYYGSVPKNIWNSPLPKPVKQDYWKVAKPYSRVKRMAVNAVIQGTAAEFMKIAMINLWKHLQTKGSDWKIIGTVHDEVLVEVPDTITIEEVEEIEEMMKSGVDLGDMPVKVDTEFSKVWGKGISKKEWIENGCKVN